MKKDEEQRRKHNEELLKKHKLQKVVKLAPIPIKGATIKALQTLCQDREIRNAVNALRNYKAHQEKLSILDVKETPKNHWILDWAMRILQLFSKRRGSWE